MNPDWRISVIMTCDCHTAADDDLPVDLVLRGLASQTVDMRRHEILVIDGTGTDLVSQRLAGLEPHIKTNVRVITLDQCGRPPAWNAGIRAATGDLLLLLGADFIPDPHMIEEHLHFHDAHPAEGAIAIGPGIFPPHLSNNQFACWLEKTGRLFGVSFTDPAGSVSGSFFYCANASVKKSFLQRVGGFDEIFPYHALDDYELGLRLLAAGGWVKYLPRARAVHEHDLTLPARRAGLWKAGFSAACFAAKYPQLPLLFPECSGWPVSYAFRAWCWWLAYLLSGTGRARENYWKNSLSHAIAAGYRAACRAA